MEKDGSFYLPSDEVLNPQKLRPSVLWGDYDASNLTARPDSFHIFLKSNCSHFYSKKAGV